MVSIELLLDGKPVWDELAIQGASSLDTAGGAADTCRIDLGNRKTALAMGIHAGMRIEIRCGGYTTGEMLLDEPRLMDDGTVRLSGRSTPDTAALTAWGCYENVSISNLLQMGADALGMDYAMYGFAEKIDYRRIVKRGESWPRFLQEVLFREGATLKCESGCLLAIYLPWIFAQNAVRRYDVTGEQGGDCYRGGIRYRTLKVLSADVQAGATDTDALGARSISQSGEQVYSTAQAKRWARGMLLSRNVQAEEFRMRRGLDTGIAAMSRIDLAGLDWVSGKWYVQSILHDFVRGKSELHLGRCIETIR